MHNESIITNNSCHLSLSNSLIAKFKIAEAMTVGDTENAGEEGIHKINKNKDKNKEAKLKICEAQLKLSKEGVEGDVSNGIERRVKKKIQTKGIVERSYRDWENVFGGQSGRICRVKRMESSISRS